MTQTDMNIGAGEELKKETARLEACDAELLKNLPSKRHAQYKSVQRSWDEFLKASATFEADGYKGGSIAPLIYANSAIALTQTRIEQVQARIEQVQERFGDVKSA